MTRAASGIFRGLLSLSCAAPLACASAETPEGPRWACWYEPEPLGLSCLLVRAPTGGRGDVLGDIPIHLANRFPPQLITLWRDPQSLVSRRVHIPLWNVPYDMRDAERLADSVMCGLRDDCSVLFDSNSDDRARERALAIRGGASESVVTAGTSPLTAGSRTDAVGKRRRAALR